MQPVGCKKVKKNAHESINLLLILVKIIDKFIVGKPEIFISLWDLIMRESAFICQEVFPDGEEIFLI